MIFKAKNNELAIFGNTLEDIKRKVNDFNKIRIRKGLFGEEGAFSSLFSGEKAKTIITPELLSQFDDFRKRFNNSTLSAEALAEEMSNVDSSIVSYAKTCKNGELTTESFINALKQQTLSAKAATAAAKALALAGNMLAMWAAAQSVKLLAKGLDGAADSISDVETRIQENRDALTDYTSKIEELTEKLKDLNSTNTASFSDDEKEKLKTEASYIESQIKLYNQLAEAKQKAVNEDTIKAVSGKNEEVVIKKLWEEAGSGRWEDAYSTLNEANGKHSWYDIVLPGLGKFLGNVDDGNYLSEADKLLAEYQELQNKYTSLQQFAIKNGNSEALSQKLEETKSQMTQTSASLAQSIEKIQTARDSLANSPNKDEYADIIKEWDEDIATYQEALTGNVYASKYVGLNDLQRDLIGVRDVIQVISTDLNDLPALDPLIKSINCLLEVIDLLKTYSFSEILDIDKIILGNKLGEINEQLQNLKETFGNGEFWDNLKSKLSDTLPPEFIENLEKFQKGIEAANNTIRILIQRIGDETGLSNILSGFSSFIDQYGFLFKDAVNAWNEAHQLDYSDSTENNMTVKEEPPASGANVSYETLTESSKSASDAVNTLRSSISSVNDAFAEQTENGSISVDTMLAMVDAGYAAALQFDAVTGACTINKEAMFDLVQAKIQNQIADLQLLQSDIQQKLAADGNTAKESANGFYDLSKAKLAAASAEQLASMEQFNDAEAQINALQNALKNIDKIKSGSYSTKPITSSAKSTAKAASKTLEEIQREWKDLLDKSLTLCRAQLDAGLIDFKTYLSQSRGLLEEYYRDGKVSASDYFSSLQSLYQDQLSLYDKVVSAVTDQIDRRVDRLKEEKSAIEESYQLRISKIQEEIDSLEKASAARQEQIDLEKAQYALERAQTQRPDRVYRNGQILYDTDSTAIRDADEELEERRQQMKLSLLESQIGSLEKEMGEATAVIDTQIEQLEAYKEQWNSVAEEYDRISNEMLAQQILGADWEEQILAGRMDILEAFKNDYIATQQAMADAAWASANEQMRAAKEAEKGAAGSSGSAGDIAQNHSSAANEDSDHPASDSGTYEIIYEDGGQFVESKYFPSRSAAEKYAEALSYGISEDEPQYYVKKYASGTNHAAPGFHLVGEHGREIILDECGKAILIKRRQLYPFAGGEKVINHSQTERTLKQTDMEWLTLPPHDNRLFNISDISLPASFLQIPSLNSFLPHYSAVPANKEKTILIQMRDINLEGVQDGDSLAKSIITKFPSRLLQELYKK